MRKCLNCLAKGELSDDRVISGCDCGYKQTGLLGYEVCPECRTATLTELGENQTEYGITCTEYSCSVCKRHYQAIIGPIQWRRIED